MTDDPGRAMRPIPVLACTATSADAEAQRGRMRALRTGALLRETIEEQRVQLWLRDSPEIEADIHDFIEREQRCFSFFAFSLDRDAERLRFEASWPAEAGAAVAELFLDGGPPRQARTATT